MKEKAPRPWHEHADSLKKRLSNADGQGLSAGEANSRLNQYGANQIEAGKGISIWESIINQFRGPLVILLGLAGLLSFLTDNHDEGIAIVAVLLVNAVIGFIMEYASARSMDALKKLEVPVAKAWRDGNLVDVPSSELVPGDQISLEAGDIIPADARLIRIARFHTDESALTGESFPCEKDIHPLPEGTALHDRKNMVWKGTIVTQGNAVAIITSTGMNTELGKIAAVTRTEQREKVPLQEKLDFFSKRLAWIAVICTLPVILSGFIQGQHWVMIIETAIALMVAAIPEGLPIVATISLANGMLRLSRQNVIVKDLNAVETIGATTVILSDKTGTLTQNKLYADTAFLPGIEIKLDTSAEINEKDASSLDWLLHISSLCNNALIRDNGNLGDPLEVALLEMNERMEPGSSDRIRSEHPRLAEEPFDASTRMMRTLHEKKEGFLLVAKGAAEEMVRLCHSVWMESEVRAFSDELKSEWLIRIRHGAGEGLRMLGFAFHQPETHSLYPDKMIFVGMIGFIDPPRPEVKAAVETCIKAGIRVVMVTGDHPVTAAAIAQRVGIPVEGDADVIQGKDLPDEGEIPEDVRKKILHASVLSRVTPVQKLQVVKLWQETGAVAAMTGDGINDAPALKKAQVGIAMGLRGTEVAREAAKMVLRDDSFSSIARAIRYGRSVLENIRTFIVYLLSCNLSEILVVTAAGLLPWASPLHPLQILFLNLVTDVFPALALGMGKGEAGAMEKPPRDPAKPLLSKKEWIRILLHAVNITVFTIAAGFADYQLNGANPVEVRNVLFFSIGFAQLFFAFNLREDRSHIFRNPILRNPHLWLAILFCSILFFGVNFFPAVGEFFHVDAIPEFTWMWVAAAAFGPVIWYQFRIEIKKIMSRQHSIEK